MLGQDFDRNDLRLIAVAVRHSLRDPATEHPILMTITLEPLAAAMRGRVDRLEQQQTLIRRRGRKTPSARLTDQMFVVLVGARIRATRA